MATTTILREDENAAVVMVNGAGIESLGVFLNPGSTGPIGATGLYGATGLGLVSVEKLDWSITGTNKVSLYFNGTTDQLIGHYDGSGRMDYLKEYQTKITNVASGADATMLITTTTTDPYVLVMKLEKTSGFNKVGQYR